MNRKFVIGALLMLATAGSGAAVTYREVRLLQAITEAEVVVHARIARIEPRTFKSSRGSLKCGTDYFVEVLETFKGKHLRERSFSFEGEPHAVIFHTVQAGDEMLLLLQPRETGARPEGGFVDVVQEKPSAAERTCLSTLSPWTLQYSEAGGFPLVTKPSSAADQTPKKWLAYVRIRTLLPASMQSQQVPFNQNCKPEECERASRRMVPWLPLRAEILRSLAAKP